MSGTGEGQGKKTVTACVLLIGDEILSGRTKDSNLSHIAHQLNQIGIQVREARGQGFFGAHALLAAAAACWAGLEESASKSGAGAARIGCER